MSQVGFDCPSVESLDIEPIRLSVQQLSQICFEPALDQRKRTILAVNLSG